MHCWYLREGLHSIHSSYRTPAAKPVGAVKQERAFTIRASVNLSSFIVQPGCPQSAQITGVIMCSRLTN